MRLNKYKVYLVFPAPNVSPVPRVRARICQSLTDVSYLSVISKRFMRQTDVFQFSHLLFTINK